MTIVKARMLKIVEYEFVKGSRDGNSINEMVSKSEKFCE